MVMPLPPMEHELKHWNHLSFHTHLFHPVPPADCGARVGIHRALRGDGAKLCKHEHVAFDQVHGSQAPGFQGSAKCHGERKRVSDTRLHVVCFSQKKYYFILSCQ